MNQYFLNELDNLKEIGQEFSQANPTLAPLLSQTSADPDVERILEGVAFLTAGIRQKIDDDFPEFSQGLLNQVFPHYLRPIPSATIIEFKPTPILKNVLITKAGTYLDSIEVDEVKCRYRTTFDVEVIPLSITSVRANETSTGRRVLDVSFVLNGMNLSAWKSDRLRLHIGGDYQGAVDTFFLLSQYLESIAVVDAQGNESTSPDLKLVPVGFDEDFKLLDYPSNSFPAYRLIQEYFLLKEKFLFIDVSGLGKHLNKTGGNAFSLRFNLKELPMQMPKLSNSRFILHASPAVNLFSHEAESFLNDYKRNEYLLRPIRNSKKQYQIYTVDDVVGNNRKQAQKNHYTPMGLFDPEQNSTPVYQTYTRAGEQGGVLSYIRFSYPRSHDLENKESVQIELTCSNGNLTSKLKAGDINQKTSNTSELVDFSNINQPSDSQAVPTGKAVLWRLLSHLTINYLSLADADNLKSLLELYIFSGHSGNKQEVANRKRIDGITDVKVNACDRLVTGVPMRGQAVQVTVNSTHYTSKGDMYLFGMLLDRLMSSFASLNCFTEFSLLDSATDEVYRWPIRAGDRPLI
ncbi:MAG: type VI secretion system protein ImpG [Gammaproteobacteria bacterium]|jgi:type VI secretion system protein ImpG